MTGMNGTKDAIEYEKWTLCSSTMHKIAVRKVSGSLDNPWNGILKPPIREIIQNMTEKISKATLKRERKEDYHSKRKSWSS